MSNINKFLANILSARYGKDVRQSIHDAIKEIDGVADTAQNSATQSAKNASSYMASAKTYASNASTSETNAKTYAEQAKASAEQAISTTPEGYNALVEQVGLMDTQTTTSSTLYNSKEGGMKLVHMDGNSEQRTYAGNQLVDFENATYIDSTGATHTFTNDVLTIVGDGTATYQMTNINITDVVLNNPGKTLSFNWGSITETNTDYTGTIAQLMITDTESTKSYVELRKFAKKVNDYVIPSDVTTISKVILQLYTNNSSTAMANTVTITKPILHFGEEKVDYEPYVGGIASPNPDYPQVIENTGDCVEMMQGTYNNTTGAHTSNAERICNKHKIPCKNGDVVNVKFEKAVNIYSRYYNEDTFITNYDGADNVTEYSFTIPSDATHFNFVVALYGGGNITPQTVGKITLTINNKYVVPVKMCGKNLWNGVNVGKGLDSSGNLATNGAVTTSDFIKVKSGVTYYFSRVAGNNIGRAIALYDENKKFIKAKFFNGNSDASAEYTIEDKCVYIRVSAPINLETQVEEGTVATPYEPYTEHTEYILLDEPLRKVRDVADQIVEVDNVWGVERVIEEVIFNGTENWGEATSNNRTLRFTDLTIGANWIRTAYLMCTHYKRTTSYWTNAGDDTCGFMVDNTKQFGFIDSTYTSKADWLAFLQSSPITMQYVVATPTFTPLDAESQKALNRLKTFNSVTYVEVDSVVQPSGMEFEYGTSKVGAYTLRALNENNIDKIERAELKAQLEALTVATE